MSTPTRNRKAKDRKNRLKLRAKLTAEGLNEQLIEKIIDQQRHDDLVVRHGLDEALQIRGSRAGTLASPSPDDTGYRPTEGDPLLRGPARVGGIAAKVVKRRDTITRFQYDKAKP